MMRRLLFLLALCLPLAATPASAQRGDVVTRPLRPNRRLLQRQQLPGDSAAGRRLMLQRQIRQGLWRAAKQRIGLTDEQMTRLEQTSQRFDQRRRVLAQEEKTLRTSLRAETLADTAANQGAIATSMDRLLQLQHQRI